MILLAVAAVLIVLVPLLRGDLARLGAVNVRAVSLAVAAVGLQVVVINALPHALPADIAAALHLITYGLAAVFVWRNRRLPGMPLIAAGGGANLTAIAANGGVMPASPQALAVSGVTTVPGSFSNSAVVEAVRLGWLGDVFAVPAGWPLANVFSAGDLLLVAGLAVALHRICGPGARTSVPAARPPGRSRPLVHSINLTRIRFPSQAHR